MAKNIILFLFLSVNLSSQAGIWTVNNTWSQAWEEKYQEFVQKDVVADMFTNSKSPYFGLSLDCADAAYAIRAIFASKNGLPFALTNPTGSRVNPLWTQDMERWDHLSDTQARLKAFIAYIADSVGTENLARKDTFPPTIKSINSGDIFMFRRGSGDGLVRHTYFIQNVDEFGNFDLLYSTQIKKRDKQPLGFKKGQTLYNSPVGNSPNWGFRRFKNPEYFESTNSIPNYSLEQYVLADKLSDSAFFRHVQQMLRSTSESPERLIKRRLNDVCSQSVDRIDAVNNGVNYANKTNQCMGYEDYDVYSTPSRDGRLKSAFTLLKEDVAYLKEQKLYDTEVLKEQDEIIRGIFETNDTTYAQKVYDFCPVNFAVNTEEIPEPVVRDMDLLPIVRKSPGSLSLREIYNSIDSQQLSFHPNDNLYRRWGFQYGKQTACKVYYD